MSGVPQLSSTSCSHRATWKKECGPQPRRVNLPGERKQASSEQQSVVPEGQVLDARRAKGVQAPSCFLVRLLSQGGRVQTMRAVRWLGLCLVGCATAPPVSPGTTARVGIEEGNRYLVAAALVGSGDRIATVFR